MQNIAFYMIIMTMVIQVIPNTEYKKYIRFFSGLILVLLLATPIFSIFGMNTKFDDIYNDANYRQAVREIEESTKYLEDIQTEDYLNTQEGEEREKKIHIEEVEIEP